MALCAVGSSAIFIFPLDLKLMGIDIQPSIISVKLITSLMTQSMVGLSETDVIIVYAVSWHHY